MTRTTERAAVRNRNTPKPASKNGSYASTGPEIATGTGDVDEAVQFDPVIVAGEPPSFVYVHSQVSMRALFHVEAEL